jgi:hypothetical protein
MVNPAGTAPASYGLKDRRATFLLRVQSGPRFQRSVFTDYNLAAISKMMNSLALHLERCVTRSAMRAYDNLHWLSPMLVLLAGFDPAFHAYRACALATRRQKHEW